MNKEKFYSISRGSLNLNGKFYYGLDYEITDFMRNMEQENTNLKQALNEIREYINNTTTMIVVGKPLKLSEETSGKDILQIIDKVLGDD